jgi:hypothetical protein
MFQEFNEHTQFILASIIVSIVGGIANWLMDDSHTVMKFLVAVFLAGFAGFLVGQICLESKISESWSFFFCGAAGLSAELVLKIARKMIINKLGAISGEDVSKELYEINKHYFLVPKGKYKETDKAEEKNTKKKQEQTQHDLDRFLAPEDEEQK